MQVTRMGRTIVQNVSDRIFIQQRRSRQLEADVRIIPPAPFFAGFQRTGRTVITIWSKRVLVAVVVAAVGFSADPGKARSAQLAQDAPQVTQSAPLAPEALQQLVAPIALYPDALVAQILAASTYPSQIVEADRWLQDHSKLKDDKLAKEVDKQSWDPSIKALTAFSSVLANLDTNLSWTSALGDAYFNQQQDVLDAVQVLRARARDAGNLQSTSQQTVTSQGSTIVIEPADPDVCYLPTYDPWLVYGAPIGIYPGYIYNSWIGGPYVSFGLGIGIGGGFWGGFGWGFHSWGTNWRSHSVTFNHNNYFSNSRTFFRRSPGGDSGNFRGGQGRTSFQGNRGPGDDRNRAGGVPDSNFDRNRDQGNFDQNRNQGIPNPNFDRDRGGAGLTPGAQSRQDFRGFGQPGPNTGTRSGAFSGFGQGGIEQGSASRGRGSFGGGGGFGGGGMRGGGFGGGGGRGGGRH